MLGPEDRMRVGDAVMHQVNRVPRVRLPGSVSKIAQAHANGGKNGGKGQAHANCGKHGGRVPWTSFCSVSTANWAVRGQGKGANAAARYKDVDAIRAQRASAANAKPRPPQVSKASAGVNGWSDFSSSAHGVDKPAKTIEDVEQRLKRAQRMTAAFRCQGP
jgi:hypothetical protein